MKNYPKFLYLTTMSTYASIAARQSPTTHTGYQSTGNVNRGLSNRNGDGRNGDGRNGDGRNGDGRNGNGDGRNGNGRNGGRNGGNYRNSDRGGDRGGYRKDVRYTGPEPSEMDDQPILFPCLQCKGRLPTKIENGQIVKRYPDDTCAHCWAANDIISHPEKYGFTRQLQLFLSYLEPDDIPLLLEHPEHTLTADLYTYLVRIPRDPNFKTTDYGEIPEDTFFEDPVKDRDDLVAFLDPIKAYNLPLLVRLHKRVIEG